MNIFKRLFGRPAGVPRSRPFASSFGGDESLGGGLKRLCIAEGIAPDELYRAMSGNTATRVVEGRLRISVASWLVCHKRAGKCYTSNLGALTGGEPGAPVSSETLIDPQASKPWIGSRELDPLGTPELWRNGPIGPFKYDFPEVVSMMESQGYELSRFMGSANYLLQKIRVAGKLRVVWKIFLSKNGGGLDGASFVDANTGELHVLYFDESKQEVKIEPNP